ncbi:MAG: extracellular solute-binding protein [Planctomycetes bacterium]|nr:extracellular solute-binding protein [Planctomycetota bacterium]
MLLAVLQRIVKMLTRVQSGNSMLFLGMLTLLVGCGKQDSRQVVTLWHQMRPADRAVLESRLEVYEQQNPEIDVRALYKENEELRSGLESAVLVGAGPDIVYGPWDTLGVYNEIGAVQDMTPWFPSEVQQEFDPRTLAILPDKENPSLRKLYFVGDRFGNHLALVYNRNLLKEPPQTTDELIVAAKANTVDETGDGRPDRFGIVWNYTEPFFVIPFLTGHGAWVFANDAPGDGRSEVRPVPELDTPQAIAAYQFVADLKTKYHVLPISADYNVARELFLSGKAAMLIDGDWSWQDYVSAEEIDAAIAPLPIVSSTGLPMKPMVSPKGYSLSIAAQGKRAEEAMQLIRFLTDTPTQLAFLEQQKIIPSRMSLRDHPLLKQDPTLITSFAQTQNGRLMPLVTEMRAVWDAMKPPYQSLMSGNISAADATRQMQQSADRKIAALTGSVRPGVTAPLLPFAGFALLLALLVWQRHRLVEFFRDLRRNRLAYAFALPSLLAIFLVVVFPLVFNVALSFSNMSLQNFRDWEIVGFHNYASIFFGDQAAKFWGVFFKTIFWTAINVSLHVSIGVLLAVVINGPIRGKAIYRLLLIIPWAVPAYITALTWRGMFDYQFGVVNQGILAINHYLPAMLHLPILDWLNLPNPAFAACIIANVWLGFPFMMVIALGGLQGIPQELYEAARIDRATRWQQFWNITLPMLKPVLIPAVTLGAIWTFNNLNVVWLVSNGGEPSDQTHILVSYVYKAVFNLYQYGYGAALSMVIFLMLLVFSIFFLHKTQATEGVH